MERDRTEDSREALELGVASVHTEGGMGEIIEPMGLWHRAGISEA